MSSTHEGKAVRAYIAMGSNLGDRAGNLLLGVRGMMSAGLRVLRFSSVYETEPVGVEDEQPAYLNMAAELVAPLPSPEELLALLLRIERDTGRRRVSPRAARTLDLDLLLYGDERRATDALTLPHPRLHLRRFVLAPLAELAPHARHPSLHMTIAELLATTEDDSRVELWKPGGRMKDEG
ncbi:MAG: 2-amino-4-hydroxy-6-hydroxymethyldihydropteridine diphosphokinase [Acidobacteriota bacterium]|jgi:2-amino-4-hydroxy-6-hydroxymethyldihydropteridine diphosphokinase|nr:2-amino-4-hydroxy-6-hydroxymethyldihydropteridine diphosphokinase [Acidobacteriota bacterium]